MYIYENHMGGLYATDYEQDYEDMYCEQCGDSDWLVGEAETLEDAWELLYPDTDTGDHTCDLCEVDQDIDYEKCGECQSADYSGNCWNIDYVMKFLEGNFEIANPTYVVLAGKNKENEKIFAKWNSDNTVSLPFCFCIDEKYAEKLAKQLSYDLEEPDFETIKKIGKYQYESKKVILFECYEGGIPEEGAHWNGDDTWAGFFDIRDSRFNPADVELLKCFDQAPKRPLFLGDLLKELEAPESTLVMERVFVDIPEMEEPYDSLFGYCRYIDGDLVPEDGDSYYLTDEVIKYEDHLADKEDPYLCVWIATETNN